MTIWDIIDETDKVQEEEEVKPEYPSVTKVRECLYKEQQRLKGVPNGLCSKYSSFYNNKDEQECYKKALKENPIEWRMQSEEYSGGYGFIGGNVNQDYSLNWAHSELEYNEKTDNIDKTSWPIKPEKITSSKELRTKTDCDGVIKVTSETAPGIQFLGKGTFNIGGYILKNPLIYTISSLKYLKEYRFYLQKWASKKFLLLSSIPNNLKDMPHDYKALEESEFGVELIDCSTEQIAYYLNWLEKSDNNWKFARHCYTRYIDGLWLRAFIELKNLEEITVRFFQLCYFNSDERSNMFEIKRALASYFLAVKNGVSFSEDDKDIIASNFEVYFMQYHYKYKPVLGFDPVGVLSSLGHHYLPKSIMMLEYFGQYYSLWEDSDMRRHFQYAIAATSYFIRNMNISFKTANEPRTLVTYRKGLELTISYYGGIEFTAQNAISPLAFIREVMRGSDSLYRLPFFDQSQPDQRMKDFSWDKEYDMIFDMFPDTIKANTPFDAFPVMKKINRLLSICPLTLLDVLLEFHRDDYLKDRILEYEDNRLKMRQSAQKKLYSPSLRPSNLKCHIEKIVSKMETVCYTLQIDKYNDVTPFSEIFVHLVDKF